MVTGLRRSGDSKELYGDFPVRDDNREITERAERLRTAVRSAGGNLVVARRAGMQLGTLNRYIAGRDMKASAMIRLARACDVSLDWLASGRDSAPDPIVAPPEPTPPRVDATAPSPLPPDLFSFVNVDKLVGCLEAAEQDLQPRFGKLPLRKIVQVALVLYDALTAQAAEEAAIAAASGVRDLQDEKI